MKTRGVRKGCSPSVPRICTLVQSATGSFQVNSLSISVVNLSNPCGTQALCANISMSCHPLALRCRVNVIQVPIVYVFPPLMNSSDNLHVPLPIDTVRHYFDHF
jgi:hypothetical protein